MSADTPETSPAATTLAATTLAATTLAAKVSELSPEKQALLAARLAARNSARVSQQAAGLTDAPAQADTASRKASEAIAPRTLSGHAPLTYAQELLWLHEQMTPGTSAYNVPVARRIRGAVHLDALAAAFDALVVRHEALRTHFVEVDGTPRQVVDEPAPVTIEVHDLQDVAVETRETRAMDLLREAAARPFDLSVTTTPRVVLVRLAALESLLLIVVHHTMFDGGSIPVLFRDLAALHDAAQSGLPATLKPLGVQIADYAAWERDTLTDAGLASSAQFWRTYLQGAGPAVELPTDNPRRIATASKGARYAVTLPAEAQMAVRALAAAHQTTLYAVLLAAFQAVVARHTGSTDIVIGTAVSGRARTEAEELIGYLANTLPMRARISESSTFAELLRQAHASTIHALDHQEVPFAKLARELRTSSDSDAALFTLMFAMQGGSAGTSRLGEALLEPVGVELGEAKFDVSVSAAELPGGAGIRVAVEYRSELFREDTIARLVAHLGNVLLAATRAPHTQVTRLPLLTEAEEHEQLVSWNATDAEWNRSATLHGLFTAQVRARPADIAVQDANQALTYAELGRRANAIAWTLADRGVGVGALVAVCMEKSADTVAVLLGVLQAGAAYVPLDPTYPDDRLAFVLRDSSAALIVTERDLSARVRTLGADTLIAADCWSETATARSAHFEGAAQSHDLCYVIYTSGSTGQPKGVLVEHRNVVRLLFNSRFQFAFGPTDVWTVFHSFAFDFSVWEMYGALLYGGRLVVVSRDTARQPAEYVNLLESEGVTILNQVPSAFYALMQEELSRPERTDGLRKLRYVIFGGEALQPALLRDWKSRYPATTLVNMFGITETTVHVTFKEIGEVEILNGASNIGGPIPTLTTYVLDAHLQLLPRGATGELCVGGAGVARGYLNRDELTRARFVAHPFKPGERLYRSGDLGRLRPDGAIEYLGRGDAQVKLRGFRIELGEIEATLAQHPAVAACTVVIRDEGPTGPRLVAYFVRATDTAPAAGDDHAQFRTALLQQLPEFMVPSMFVELPVLPLTSNGKVDRKALPAPAAAMSSATHRTAPRTDIERVLASIWSDILGASDLDVEKSFFELGGHSLLAIRVVAQIARVFRARLTLRQFFAESSVAGCARALVALDAKPGQAASIAALLLRLQKMSPEEREAFRTRQTASVPNSGPR